MVITWYGYSCFRIQEQLRGQEVSVITDPYAPEGKCSLPRNLSSDIVTISHDHARHNNVGAVGGTPYVIDGPGEYEIRDAFITGVASYHDLVGGKQSGKNTLYYITVNDIHMAHLGDLKHPLEEKHMGELHDIDVLFVPVGGGEVLDAKQAQDVVGQFEPRIIVPMHFKEGACGAGLAGVDAFLKAMGIKEAERSTKLKLTRRDLPQDEMRIIVPQLQ